MSDPGEDKASREGVSDPAFEDDAPSLADSFGLEAREELLGMAEKVTNVGTFAWDVTSDVIHWSANLYSILGYDPAETRPTAEAFFARIHPDDVEWVRDVTRRGLGAREPEPVDFRVVRPDGSVRHVHMIGAKASEDDRSPRFVGAILDMTDRVEAEANLRRREQAFRRAQQVARVGTFAWNPVTGESEWSEQLHRMCGVPLDVKGTAELFFSMIHPEDRERILSAVASMKPGGPIGPWEYRIIRTDGEIVDVYGEASPTFDHHGNPTGYVGTALDITLRKRFEAQLLQSHKMESLGRLAGGIAHDFNNLLTIIGAHARSLRRRLNERSLDEIARAVERAGELTQQLLAFGRQAVLERRAIDPAPIVRESVGMMRRVLGEHIELELDTDRVEGRVTVEDAQVEQILLNLVLNARDAIEGSGAIKVSLRDESLDASPEDAQPTVAPGAYVVLCVEDDGSGMEESVKRRVLEPFFTTKAPGEGTGLGLAMVYGIASQHGGGVVIDSRPGSGTLVRVLLPSVPEDDREASPRGDSTSYEGSGELLLLVDDEAALRSILGAVLEDAGFRVLLASGGEEALRLFQASREPIAAVITDVVMPKMGGVDLVRALREEAPELPALYMSGYARASGTDEDDASVRGSFIQKPCTPEELVSRVNELLAGGSS